MKTIWKFPLAMESKDQLIEMPRGAQVVNVDMQDGRVCLWAIVDEDMMEEPRIFVVSGTGWGVASYARYVGTAAQGGGGFVWHVWEV